MKSITNYFLIIFTYTTFSFNFIGVAVAQEGCVIPPSPTYESSNACVYTPYSGKYDLLDSCYQKYLSIKNDFSQRCRSYWDSKKTISSPNVPTSTTQVIQVIKEVVVTPTLAPRRIYPTIIPTERPIPTLEQISITPSDKNYYEESQKENSKYDKSGRRTIFQFLSSFIKTLFGMQ